MFRYSHVLLGCFSFTHSLAKSKSPLALDWWNSFCLQIFIFLGLGLVLIFHMSLDGVVGEECVWSVHLSVCLSISLYVCVLVTLSIEDTEFVLTLRYIFLGSRVFR